MNRKKVLLLEFNEINWHVIDKLIAARGRSFLPNFVRLREQGAWALQSAVERPPLLDPWVTWVTLHTGVSPAVHGASVLEQDAQTIKAKRTWDYVIEAGRSVGIFGSISAFPPQPVKGFMVPGPFAPSDSTFPDSLRPIQSVNRRYTQAHNKTSKAPGSLDALKTGVQLLRMGLTPRTCLRIAAQLVREKFEPHSHWRRVCLQPLLNFDVFSKLYKTQRPDFATWHSNHAAHFMHHYWRAWDDSAFKVKAAPEEQQRFGAAVPFGYQVCDELLGRAFDLIGADTVLVVASSMGQQPYVSEKYVGGKIVVRIRDMETLLNTIGRVGVKEYIPTMVPQWNLTMASSQERDSLMARFSKAVREVNGVAEPAFAASFTGNTITLTPLGLADTANEVSYRFQQADGSLGSSIPLEALFATDTPTVKQGMHHISGVLAFYGAGIRKGINIPECTNLDVAPTILAMLGLGRPSTMEGRSLNEVYA